jgi:aryl-alcohol dehydrogenase-like predicted oxidoreductase
MEFRRLGRTGRAVSRLGLGLAALGRPGYINLGHADDLGHDYAVEGMRQRTCEVLDAAWRGGVRYFDVARSYGRGEEFLAGWLSSRRIAAGDVTVGSKWGYTYTAAWQVEARHHEIKQHSVEVLRRQIEESRILLGPHLRLYQIHSATLESGVLENRAVLDELARLRDEGLVIGLTLSGARQSDTLHRALEIEIDGRRLFDVVQATWNLLEPSAGAALAEASAAGLGVIIKEALANGRLTARNRAPDFESRRAALSRAAASLATTIDAVALAAALAQPWADVVLSGAATVPQLESNLRATQVSWNADVAGHLAALAESPRAYWATRAELSWN